MPCARCKAPTICTITLLRSLAGPGGAFDTPKSKCPPDRGSSEWVTDIPASLYPNSPSSPSLESYFPIPKSTPSYRNSKPPTSIDCSTISANLTGPRAIPIRGASDSSTPPLTPDGGSDCSDPNGSPVLNPKHEKDALDFLMTLFPRNGLDMLPHAKSISISSSNLGASFDGMVLNLPDKPKTLYVDAKSAHAVSLRESVVALLDLADEHLGCSALVLVLERSSPVLGKVLHSLMYVGGTVVTTPPFPVDPAFVLVGMEI